MSSQTKLLGIAAITLATIISSCKENSSTPLTPEQTKTAQVKHDKDAENYLEQMEAYSKFESAVNENTYGKPDAAQFMDMIVDSAGRKMELFLPTANGFAFFMDHKKRGYKLHDIQLLANSVDGEGASNMHSYEVHMVDPSSVGKENVKRTEDAQTLQDELNYYKQYGAEFNLGMSPTNYRGHKIPAFAHLYTPKGDFRLTLASAMDAVHYYESARHMTLKSVGTQTEEFVSSGQNPEFKGYVLRLGDASKGPGMK